MSHEHEEEQGESPLKIVDRRRFDERGEARTDVPDQATPAPSKAAKAPAADAPPKSSRSASMSPDFASFCLSLASSAQMALGLMEHPITKKQEKSLPIAKQTIDILTMLHEKTKGNLSQEEEGLMRELLYTLQMQFVEANK